MYKKHANLSKPKLIWTVVPKSPHGYPKSWPGVNSLDISPSQSWEMPIYILTFALTEYILLLLLFCSFLKLLICIMHYFSACFTENIFYFCFDCILLLLLLCSFLKLLLALWSPMLSGARTLATKEGKWASGNFWAILAIQPRIWLLPRRPTS